MHSCFEVHLPHLLDAGVHLGLVERVVQVAFLVLVPQQHLEPAHGRVDERAVVRHVLLLHHADFLVEVAAGALGHGVAQVHVEVHRLLLARGEDERAERGADVAGLGVARHAHGVERVAMVRDGRAARG